MFHEQGFEAGWLSLIQHHAEFPTDDEQLRLLHLRFENTPTTNRIKVSSRDPGRVKGGIARHAGTYATEVKKRLSLEVGNVGVDLSSKAQKRDFIQRAYELFVDEENGFNGFDRPAPGTDITKINPILIKSRRTIEDYVRLLSRSRPVQAERVAS